MARVYGTASTGGTNSFRVGYEIGPWSAVTSSSTTVSADFQFFVSNQFAVTNDLQTFDITWTESGAGTLALGGITSPFQVQITSTSSTNSPSTTERNIGPVRTVTYTYGAGEYGSSPNFTGTITGQGSGVGVNGFYTGGPATYNWSIPIPARPGGPPSIQSVLAVAGIRSASINWTPNAADPAITSYTVVRNDGTSIGVSGLAASDTSLGNLATASYTVTAFNPAGQGSLTSNSITTPSLPSQPSSLAANAATFGQISLSWTASTTTGDFGGSYVNTYTIARNGTSLGTTTSLSYNDTTVAAATAYTYTVTPSTSVGTGTSASVSATSLGGVVNVRSSLGTWIKVVPQVRNSANTAWVAGQARARNNTTSEWKYGS